jgi:hypothetical protein
MVLLDWKCLLVHWLCISRTAIPLPYKNRVDKSYRSKPAFTGGGPARRAPEASARGAPSLNGSHDV